ncbi:MAG: PAC2 family protein [Micrococcus sp.]|nr:PAC2 family protein [Micrococcus sp.]
MNDGHSEHWPAGEPAAADRLDEVLGPLRAYLTATCAEVERGERPPAVLLLAFEGWNDAGQAATGTLEVLCQQWETVGLPPICDGDYYDYQVTRPTVRRDADGMGTIEWPSLRVSEAHLDAEGSPVLEAPAPPDGLRVLVCSGVEPNVRWRSYTDELLTAARGWGVDAIIVLGALLADVPHTRPLPARASSAHVDVRVALDAERPSYEGPTGIVGVVTDTSARAGLPTLSLWGAVPHYVAQFPSPKALLGLVEALRGVLHVPVSTLEVEAEAEAWERSVDEVASEDTDVAAYVAQLEQAADAQELPEASGDAIAREFERYLRGRRES